MLKPEGGLADVMGGPRHVHRPALADDLLQAASFDEFHHQKVQVALVVDVVGMHDVLVLKLPGGPRLAVETFEGRAIPLELVERQHLQSDQPPHEDMLAQVNRPHAADAEDFQQFVLARNEKAPPFALQDLLRLESGEQPLADHAWGNGLRAVKGRAGLVQGALKGRQPLAVNQFALADQVNEVSGTRWRRHREPALSAGGNPLSVAKIECEYPFCHAERTTDHCLVEVWPFMARFARGMRPKSARRWPPGSSVRRGRPAGRLVGPPPLRCRRSAGLTRRPRRAPAGPRRGYSHGSSSPGGRRATRRRRDSRRG